MFQSILRTKRSYSKFIWSVQRSVVTMISRRDIRFFVLKISFVICGVFMHLCLWNSIYLIFLAAEVKFSTLFSYGIDIPIALVFYLLLLKRKKGLAYWKQLTFWYNETDKRIRVLCRVLCSMAVLHYSGIALVALALCFSLTDKQMECLHMMEAFTFGYNLTLSTASTRCLACVEVYMYVIGFALPVIGVPTVISCLALVLANRFRKLNSKIQRWSSDGFVCGFNDIASLKKDYSSLRQMVVEGDDLLSGITLCWFLSAFIINCSGLMVFITSDLKSLASIQLIMFSLYHLLPFVYSAVLSFCASSIPQACMDGYLLVRDLPVSCERGERQLAILLSHLKWPPTALTLGGIFVLNQNTFISLVGCIFTYVIVMFQLYPDVMHRLAGDKY